MNDLAKQFGEIDIYLFDQILRGRIAPGMRVLDAGCGIGRNLVYLLRQCYEVFGVDQEEASVDHVRRMAAVLSPGLPAHNFRVEDIAAMSFGNDFFHAVISNAVLHFARDDRQFEDMLSGMWRVLQPGGLLFCRLASSIGIEKQIRWLEGRRFLLPDESERYLVDAAMLSQATRQLGCQLMDPLKTTVVDNQRSMTTWVLRKNDVG